MTEDENNGMQQQRVRTIAINAMMETTAIARLGRSLQTATRAGANEPGGVTFNAGNLVDVWRRPPSKDVKGWKGPYPVVRVNAEAGQIIVKMAGQDRPSRIGDVRHTLFMQATWLLGHGLPGQTAAVLLNFILEMQPGKIESFGMVNTSKGYEVTKATKQHPEVAIALHHVVQIHFGVDVSEIELIRLGRGVITCPLVMNSHRSCTIWWIMVDPENTVQIFDSDSSKTAMKSVTDDWQQNGSI